MATLLQIYNNALRFLGEGLLATTSDNVEARYVLDDAYGRSVDFVFRAAPWRFALKTTVISGATSATLLAGYTHRFTKPADWLRTHAIFVQSASHPGKEFPIDCREQDVQLYANASSLTLRYVSNALVGTPANWPEQFANAVSAYLAFEIAERITGLPAKTEQTFALYGRMVAEAARVDAVPEDPWLIPQLSGAFLSSARAMLRAGNWRFALKSATLSGSGTPLPGFSTAYPKPADWLRTQAFFVLSGSRECPIDAREHTAHWSTSAASPVVRYVSADAVDATRWPEDFLRTVAAHLGIDTGDAPAVESEDGVQRQPIWPQYLQAALQNEAIPDDPWLAHQFDGSFLQSSRFVLSQAAWRFAMKVSNLTADSPAVSPAPGFTNTFTIPADRVRDQAILFLSSGRECPVRVRIGTTRYSANTTTLMVRYVSTDGLVSTTWPDAFRLAVAAHLGIPSGVGEASAGEQGQPAWPMYLQRAIETEADPDNQWLKYQYDGRFDVAVRTVLEMHDWKFALDSASISGSTGVAATGYAYKFTKPAGYVKPNRVARQMGTDFLDIDFFDQGGELHANHDPIIVRFVSSTIGEDSTKWPEPFEAAVFAWLEYGEAQSNPKSAAMLGQKAAAWKDALKTAKLKNDLQERPKTNMTGVFVRSRYGYRGLNREQGW